MVLKINGVDFSDCFSPIFPEFSIERITGDANGVSMGGTEIEDLVRTRETAVYTSTLLTPEKLKAIATFARMETVSVIFDDPFTGEEKGPVVMIPEISSVKRIPLLGGGYAYKNLELSLREK